MVVLVIRAANLLHVDEFEVFKLASRFWHRQTDDIKTAFNKYLNKKVAPPWVLHFARSVVQAYEHGNFEPTMFGIYPSYDVIQFTWSLAFQTPRVLPLNEAANLLIA